MKKIIRIASVILACLALGSPMAEAQRHQGAGHANGSRHERTQHQGGQNGSQSRGGGKREKPSVSPSHSGGNRPAAGRPAVGNGNNGNNGHNNFGQGNHGNNNHKPSGGNHRPEVGNNKPGNHPGGGNVNNGHNGNNHRPSVGTRPNPGNNWGGGNHGNSFGHGPKPPHRPPVLAPRPRPYRPPMIRPHYRPVPPPAWRPRRGLPFISGILGLSFGAAFNISLDYLYNNGYTVDGYGNDIVYLRNVSALNYVWTDAALYYGTGGLDASSFYYSTPVYDPLRYNNVYRMLVGTYGSPVSASNAGGVMTATWFGGNRGYITLSLGAGTDGRFLTTLTMGM